MTQLRALHPEEALFATMRASLDAAELPTADLLDGDARFFAYGSEAFGGFVRLGDLALLRSIVVRQDDRNHGTGSAILSGLLEKVVEIGLAEVWLLTTGAEKFFAQRGFVRVDRSRTPRLIAQTRQFKTQCPDSAIVMRRRLAP